MGTVWRPVGVAAHESEEWRWALIEGMTDTIFKIPVGNTVGPVKMAGAWWIIDCVDREPTKIKAPEEVNDDRITSARIQTSLQQRSNAQNLESPFADFVKKSKVRVFRPGYKRSLTGQGTK